MRADAIQAGLITEESLTEARRQHDDQMRAYIQALGGQIRIVADFGDEQLRLA